MNIPWVIGLSRELDRPCEHDWDWTAEMNSDSYGPRYSYTKQCTKCGKRETQHNPPLTGVYQANGR